MDGEHRGLSHHSAGVRCERRRQRHRFAERDDVSVASRLSLFFHPDAEHNDRGYVLSERRVRREDGVGSFGHGARRTSRRSRGGRRGVGGDEVWVFSEIPMVTRGNSLFFPPLFFFHNNGSAREGCSSAVQSTYKINMELHSTFII